MCSTSGGYIWCLGRIVGQFYINQQYDLQHKPISGYHAKLQSKSTLDAYAFMVSSNTRATTMKLLFIVLCMVICINNHKH